MTPERTLETGKKDENENERRLFSGISVARARKPECTQGVHIVGVVCVSEAPVNVCVAIPLRLAELVFMLCF